MTLSCDQRVINDSPFRLERNEQRSDNPRSKCVDNISFRLLLLTIYNSSGESLNRVRFLLLQVRLSHFFQHPTWH